MEHTYSIPLDAEHFDFDYTPGFEMAIAKDWQVLDVVDLSKQFDLFDADLNAMRATKYGVRLFYKPVLPLSYFDDSYVNPLIKIADNQSYKGKYFDFIDGTPLGSPVCKISQGSSTETAFGEVGYHGLLFADDVFMYNWKNPTAYNSNYAIPDERQLNHTYINKHDFATGTSIASLKVVNNLSYQQQLKVTTQDVGSETIYKDAFLTLSDGTNVGAIASFIVNNGTLSYTISTDGGRLNVPTDTTFQENRNYLMPKLFKAFGAGFLDHITDNDTVGWMYCILGVNELSTEDEDFDHGEPVYKSEQNS